MVMMVMWCWIEEVCVFEKRYLFVLSSLTLSSRMIIIAMITCSWQYFQSTISSSSSSSSNTCQCGRTSLVWCSGRWGTDRSSTVGWPLAESALAALWSDDDDDDDSFTNTHDDSDYDDDKDNRPCGKQCDCQAVLSIAQHYPVDFCIYHFIRSVNQ